MGKSSINGLFPMAMFNNQRVNEKTTGQRPPELVLSWFTSPSKSKYYRCVMIQQTSWLAELGK